MNGNTGKKIIETICCRCHRKKGEHGWSRAVTEPSAILSHGFCPECYQKTLVDCGLAAPPDLIPAGIAAAACLGKSS